MLTVTLVLLVVNFSWPAATFAEASLDHNAQLVAKIKREILRLGTGRAARVDLKLRDGAKVKGYIDETRADEFDLVDDDGAVRTVPYPQVRKVKGHNFSTGAKVAVGVGIGLGILLLVLKDRIKGS